MTGVVKRQRIWIPSPLRQGKDERIPYVLDMRKWGTDPTGLVFKILDEDGADVTSTYSTGSASVLNSYMIKFPVIHSLVADTRYRVEMLFVVDGLTLEAYGILHGET